VLSIHSVPLRALMDSINRAKRGVFAEPKGLPLLDADTHVHEVELAAQVQDYVDSKLDFADQIEMRIRPALMLYMFNVCNTHDAPAVELDPAVRDKHFSRMYQKLQHAEKHAVLHANALPPIGVELEIEEGGRRSNRNERTSAILSKLDIEHHCITNDYWSVDSDQLEVNESYSYSAAVQARLLQELAVLGAVRVKDGKRNTTRTMVTDAMYSLHVNLGMSQDELGAAKRQGNRTIKPNLLSTLSTLAFTSPNRLDRRKTADAVQVKQANMGVDGLKSTVARLELRAFEFRDYPTYRMLYEVQLLTACFFGYRGAQLHSSASQQDRRLAVIWRELTQEPFVQKGSRTFLSSRYIDTEPERFSRAAANAKHKQQARQLMSTYARKVREAMSSE
jgi:hypothetical protein